MKQLYQFRRIWIFKFIFLAFSAGILFFNCSGPSEKTSAELEKGFQHPPEASKPRVWWHWMNGNITKNGIRADLEWMNRVGIGGFQNFDASLMTPRIVEKRLVYMTPEWKDAFRFTTELADSLGLEMAIAGSPGWSESGGPWVTPEQAMKKYVWSEIRVEGGKPFTGKLPQPPSATGTFQNISARSGFSLTGVPESPPPKYYADAAVVAFRLPEKDISLLSLQPKVTSSGGNFNLNELTDGDVSKSTFLPAAAPGKDAWIRYEFKEPVTIKALTIVGGGSGGMFGFGADPDNRSLEAGDDGINYSKVIDIRSGGIAQKTLAFKPVTAKYFRFTWKTPGQRPPSFPGSFFGLDLSALQQQPQGTEIAELVLHTVPRVNRFEDKAGFATATDLYDAMTPETDENETIKTSDIIDLTDLMNPDGTLDWTPEKGSWAVIRLGYSLTGHQNSPASPEATGLEVDKLNADHVTAYFNNYLDQYEDATGGLMGQRGLQYMITDSWEAGVQNWTDNMPDDFLNHRGYDMLPWIPVLTGHIVESAGSSDRFLWDFRKTIGELTAENHYDQLTEILNGRGMGRYTESHESGRAFIGDGMDVKRKATIPMSATWTPGGLDPGTEVATRYKADVRESASVAHIYGQNLVAAESMTAIGSAWAWSPELLKPTANMEMANGLNRFVIHTSVHQPVDDKIPGLGLGPFGQWFTRHETWAEQAAPWLTYLARSCFMLQQGKFVADILWFYGEDNNITALFGEQLPPVPEGYNYDFINADALLNLLSVKKGRIVTPGGMSYRLLVLDNNSRYMTLPVLKKIQSLVNDGAMVAGPKPLNTPSLSDDTGEFISITNLLWANENGINSIGKGIVFAEQTTQEVLNNVGIKPDFIYTQPQKDTKLMFVHRRLDDIDIYWINNRNDRTEDLEATFRVEGKSAEIWHPVTGKIKQAPYIIEDGVTKVPLHLETNDALFVIFRHKAKGESHILPLPVEEQLSTIGGPWKVSFQENRGAPPELIFETLSPWNENTNTGVKYFSGTGVYTNTISADEEWLNSESKLWIDLCRVNNLAEVIINGNSLGIIWKNPFRVEITEALKPGDNTLEIRVTNLWVNRLIG
ncbi:MAG: discoidin domain-containing protein, partial [Bacteroidales bacterium]|nr:discoidin domain-containing protein [Bacteroidales bacterium]